MFILAPLKRKPIAYLWAGQVLSAIGDELHKVALVWLAANLLGLNTGYLTALQAGGVFVLSVFGGIWADSWSHQRTLIWVDLIRGITVLMLPLSSFFGPTRLWVLIPVAVVVAALNALFTPSLRASVTDLVNDKSLLHATNGLMETTPRLGRIIGPGLVGFLSGVIPLIQFFTIDALSFFISAISLNRAFRKPDSAKMIPLKTTKASLGEGILGGYRLLRNFPLVKYLVLTDAVVNPAWYVVFPLAIALEFHEKMPTNIGALGLIMAAYGVGNVFSNVVVGSFKMTRPMLFSMLGRFTMGLGFVGLALAPNLSLMMTSASLAACGGPMTDLAFLTLLQREFRTSDIARIYRLDMAMTYGPLVLFYLLTPLLFKTWSIPLVIGLCGVSMIVVAGLGFFRFSEAVSLEEDRG